MNFPGSPVVKTSPSNAGGVSLTHGQGTKISHATQYGQKKKKRLEREDWGLGKTVLRKRYLVSYLKGQKKFKRRR